MSRMLDEGEAAICDAGREEKGTNLAIGVRSDLGAYCGLQFSRLMYYHFVIHSMLDPSRISLT